VCQSPEWGTLCPGGTPWNPPNYFPRGAEPAAPCCRGGPPAQPAGKLTFFPRPEGGSKSAEVPSEDQSPPAVCAEPKSGEGFWEFSAPSIEKNQPFLAAGGGVSAPPKGIRHPQRRVGEYFPWALEVYLERGNRLVRLVRRRT